MGNDCKKETNQRQAADFLTSPDYTGDDISDLIEKAQKTSPNPVGAAERQLLLTLEMFSLLDHPEDFKNNNKKNDSSSSPPQPFSEMFKWSVLSMLRNCSVCNTNTNSSISTATKVHCPHQRQALILPPFKLPSCSINVGDVAPRLDHPLSDAFVDVVEEPALRYICDSCLEMVHINRYETIQAEVKKVSQRTKGFSAGTLYMDVIDGPSFCGRNFIPRDGDEESSFNMHGVGKIQNGFINGNNNKNETPDNDHDDKNEEEEETICVSGLTLSGNNLREEKITTVLRNPDLQRVEITLPFFNQGNVDYNSGKIVEHFVKNDNPAINAVRSIRELKLTGPAWAASTNAATVTGIFPLTLFTNLQSLTVSGFSLTKKDFDDVIEGLLHPPSKEDENLNNNSKKTTNNNKKLPPPPPLPPPMGCRLLENVVLINQANLHLEDVLDTIGQLPLKLLSVANMNCRYPASSSSSPSASASSTTLTSILPSFMTNSSSSKNKDEQEILALQQQQQQTPPILISQLIMWGSTAPFQWMVDNLLPRAQFLTLIDVSTTNIFVTKFLDAYACAELSLLRIVRANSCKGTDFGDEQMKGCPPGFLLHGGVRKQISDWSCLVSLSTLQIQKFVAESSIEQLRKLSTLPSLTSIDVSFSSEESEDLFTDATVLGQLHVLASLNIHGSTKSSNYNNSRPIPRRRNPNDDREICLPNLTRLHLHSHPPFQFSFNGAPRLKQLIFASSQHSATLRGFIERGAGRCVEELCFSGEPGEGTAIEIPLASCPRLTTLTIHHFNFLSSATIAGLEACANLIRLDFSGLKSSKNINRSFSIEKMLAGMTKLEELDLSDVGRAIYFSGLLDSNASTGYKYYDGGGENSNNSSQQMLVLPNLRKFWKREGNRGSGTNTLRRYGETSSSSNNSSSRASSVGESPNLLLWLSRQPNLEQIDIEGACVDSNHFPDFWLSPAMQNKVTYLNMAHVVAPSPGAHPSTFPFLKSNSSSSPSKLKVLKWFTSWCGKDIEKMLLDVSSLRFLEIHHLSFTPRKEGENERSWSDEFVQKMLSRGVQMSNAEGHSFMTHFK